MDNNPKQVGERIRIIRKEKGMTMEEFGKLVGDAKKSAVGNWERGDNFPNNERLKRIAEIGDITVNELLNGSVKNSNVKTYIKNLITKDEFHEENNPIHASALLDTISCFEQSGLSIEDMDVVTVYLNNINFYEKETKYRIHDKQSYIEFLNLRMKTFKDQLKDKELDELYKTVYKTMIEMDKRTIQQLNQSK